MVCARAKRWSRGSTELIELDEATNFNNENLILDMMFETIIWVQTCHVHDNKLPGTVFEVLTHYCYSDFKL